MRLRHLDLLRYGHLTDARLDFPPEAKLVVVLGPNEAGKSTALAAIGDALFGFPHSTPYAFLHDTAQLRLGFTVAGPDGAESRFQRRKGRKDTLRDGADAPLPEAALQRLLGGASRDLFETTYGLNGETLRRGALALLASGGEAGESLLAGMGLPHLRKALDRLDAEARTLHGDGRGQRALAAATEAWSEKRRAAEAAEIRPRDWLAAKAALDDLYDRIEDATKRATALSAESAGLHRLRRVLPLLTSLADRRAALDEVADAPLLPEDAAATLARLVEDHRLATEDLRRETAEAETLAKDLDALPQDQAVLAFQDAIDLLAEQRIAAQNAARDLPAVERELDRYRATIAEAATAIDGEATPEALRDALPSPAQRRRAQALIRERTKLVTALAAADESLAKARDEQALYQARLAASVPPPPSAPLRHATQQAQGEGRLDRELAAANHALDAAARKAAIALAALPLWQGSAETLAATPLPLQPATDAVAEDLATTRAEAEAARRALADLADEIARLEVDIVHLARGETVPTRAVIAAERARRDQAWQAIRAAFEASAPIPPNAPDSFETLRDAADRLADARADDAARVNDYAAKSARLDLLGGRHNGAETALADATARAEVAEAAWQALWAPAGLAPQDPPAMVEWRRARAEALRLAQLEAEARAKRDEIAGRIAESRAALLALLPDAADDASLAALLAQAQDSLTATEAAETAHRTLTQRAQDAATRLHEATAGRHRARDALAAFETQWQPAAAALGLPAEADAEALEAALGAWTRIAEAATAWKRDAERVADMARTVADFATASAAMRATLGPIDPVDPAPLAILGLARRLAAARDAATAAAGLTQRLTQRRQAATTAEARRDAAERGLDALRQAAGAVDLPALEDVIRRARLRDALHTELARDQAELLRQGDGRDEAALRTEAAGLDPDQAAARLDRIEAEQQALRESLTQLGAARQQAEARLAEMTAGHDAAGLAQEARHHLAEAGLAAERYARLHLARSLLQAAIERIRRDSQAPLLRAAGGHFALLTEGRYTGLTADADEAGRAILHALRDSGAECPVEALSEGTRDQLYLALRIAAVEAHAAAAEPLPFIADDLLTSFDDARARAGLALLARLGHTTQTILFTHHAHIAELAAGLPGIVLRGLPHPARALA